MSFVGDSYIRKVNTRRCGCFDRFTVVSEIIDVSSTEVVAILEDKCPICGDRCNQQIAKYKRCDDE